jgi:hypothetical protein
VQSADAEDPWLQHEWGATLLAVSGVARASEAAVHLEVAAALFGRLAQHLALPGGAGAAADDQALLARLARVTALDGESPLTALAAVGAAIGSLEVAVNATGSPAADVTSATHCEALARLCHLRVQQVGLLQQAGESGSAEQHAPRACMSRLARQPACRRQAAALRRAVTGH